MLTKEGIIKEYFHGEINFVNCSIYCGDNVNILHEEIKNERIDLTITSPPYDNLRDYKPGYKGFDLVKLVDQLWKVTKNGGVVVWNVSDQTICGSETGTSFRHALTFIEHGWTLHDTMIYEKANFSNPSRNRYHQIFEYMFVFSKGKLKTFNPIKDKKIVGKGLFGKNTTRQKDGTMLESKTSEYKEFGMRTNIWRMNTAGQENPCKSIDHPAKMPDAMARDHILSWSNPGDVVLDPFCGSGTTGIQALKLGRRFVGIDIEPDYCSMADTNLRKVFLKFKKGFS